MAVTKTLAAIIAEVEGAKNDRQAADILKNNSSAALKTIVGYALDPLVQWLMPPGDPPYRPMPKAADLEAAFYNESRKMVYLVNSPEGKNINQIKREQIFIQMLESIDPDDAVLLLRIKNRDLNISVKAVKMAFPGIAKEW